MYRLTRKLFALIIRLRSRGKIDRNNVGNLAAGKTDIPQYYYPHKLIDAMRRLDETMGQAYLLIGEVIEILNEQGKIKLKDFIDEMRSEMSTRLYNAISGRNSYGGFDVEYLEDLDEKTFMGIHYAGRATYKEFLSLKEKYYKKIKK